MGICTRASAWLFASTIYASAALATPQTGNAAAGLQAMRETNLIVLGNMTGGNDVEGKTFIGGNLSGNSTTVGIGNSQQGEAVSMRPTLTVGGDVSTSSVNFNNGPNLGAPLGVTVGGNLNGLSLNAGNVAVRVGGNISNVNGSNGSTIRYGGSLSGNFNANGATVTHDTALAANGASSVAADVASQRTTLTADLKALSIQLGGLTIAANPSTITGSFDKPVFNAVGGSNGYALFKLTAAQFNSYSQIDFNIGSSSLPVIIDVSGASIDDLANPVGGNTSAVNRQIIWNFTDATSITLQRSFHGSLLAPLATLSNSTAIEGSIAVASYNSGGEIHLGTYAQDAPFLSAVPEPATWTLLLTGLGLTGSAMRRRRRSVAV